MMTVEEMRTLNEMLTKRMEDFTTRIDDRKQKLLADVKSDRNIATQIDLIHQEMRCIDEIWKVIREIKFDIEDITGEPEP